MLIEHTQQALQNLRKHKPLILNLTNYVTMDFIANCLLALGAAPIMSVYEKELEPLIQICSAVCINIGTLDDRFIKNTQTLAQLAQQYRKFLVLDPVGAGATPVRTEHAQYLLPYAAIVRGNASEIMALAQIEQNTKGVESIHHTNEAKQAAIQLAQRYGCTVAVSGAVDFITNGARQVEVNTGSPLMSLVTGMGCALSAVVAAFHAIIPNAFDASVAAIDCFGHCGKMAAQQANHPGLFRSYFIDYLHAIYR